MKIQNGSTDIFMNFQTVALSTDNTGQPKCFLGPQQCWLNRVILYLNFFRFSKKCHIQAKIAKRTNLEFITFWNELNCKQSTFLDRCKCNVAILDVHLVSTSLFAYLTINL